MVDGWPFMLHAFNLANGGDCDVYVVDTFGVPVPDAQITVLGYSVTGVFYQLNLPAGLTDDQGYTGFGITTNGIHTLEAAKVGYLDATADVQVGYGSHSEVTITLEAPTNDPPNDPPPNDPPPNDPPTNDDPQQVNWVNLVVGAVLAIIGYAFASPKFGYALIAALGMVR